MGGVMTGWEVETHRKGRREGEERVVRDVGGRDKEERRRKRLKEGVERRGGGRKKRPKEKEEKE